MAISSDDENKDSITSDISSDLKPQEKIYQLLVDRDEVTWRDLLFDLIKAEGMDPWDIDISLLAKKYLKTVRKLKEMDFRVSGKVVLASALLLRFKSKRLFGEDLEKLDGLINLATAEEDEYDLEGLADFFPPEEFDSDFYGAGDSTQGPPEINLKTPQPRTRKLTVMDLVDALEQAMKVKQMRQNRLSIQVENAPRVPVKKFDLKATAISVYNTVASLFKKKKKVYFNDVIKSPNKEDVVYSFIPLLHLDFSRVLHLNQRESFGDIEIEMLKKMDDGKEIASKIKL
jgi:segregation and condensation protein A